MTAQLTEDGGGQVPVDSLAHRLMLARAHAGHLTIREAAMRCGLGRTSWTNWERGKPIQHQDAVLDKIARHLNVNRKWLECGGRLNSDGPSGPDGDSATGTYPVALAA